MARSTNPTLKETGLRSLYKLARAAKKMRKSTIVEYASIFQGVFSIQTLQPCLRPQSEGPDPESSSVHFFRFEIIMFLAVLDSIDIENMSLDDRQNVCLVGRFHEAVAYARRFEISPLN